MRADAGDAADILEAERERRGLTLRGLARLLADSQEHREIEKWRRALYHYRKGGLPSPEQAVVIEKRLGLDQGSLPRQEATSAQRASRAELESGLSYLSATVARLAEAVGLLAAAQRPQLRRQLQDLLEAAPPQANHNGRSRP